MEMEFGDADFVVTRHPDTMITIEMPEPRLVLNPEQFAAWIRALAELVDAHI